MQLAARETRRRGLWFFKLAPRACDMPKTHRRRNLIRLMWSDGCHPSSPPTWLLFSADPTPTASLFPSVLEAYFRSQLFDATRALRARRSKRAAHAPRATPMIHPPTPPGKDAEG